ncbi:hypothetical protein JCM10213v2_004445 [Rhodosporidiobolus nylandii]
MLSSLRQRKDDRAYANSTSSGVKEQKGQRRGSPKSAPLQSCSAGNLRQLAESTTSTPLSSSSPRRFHLSGRVVFPSPLQQHRASLSSSTSSTPSCSVSTREASPVAVASLGEHGVSPPMLLPRDVALPRESKGKTSRLFRRTSRRTPPGPAVSSTPSRPLTHFSPSYAAASCGLHPPPPHELETLLLPGLPPPPPKEKKPQKLPRKAVPVAPAEAQQQEAKQAVSRAAQGDAGRERGLQSQAPELDVVDGLWTSTCDERADLPSSPSSRRSSSVSSSSSSTPDSHAADLAIYLSKSARRASIPSPAALASNAALSPRLARIAAFSTTLAQLHPEPEKEADAANAFETSFELPELELPWLPTLFPSGAPFLGDSSSPLAPSSPITSPAPRSPTLSSSPCYPSSPSSSDSSYAASNFSSSDAASTCSTLPTLSSVYLVPPASTHRKSLFRVQAANGAHVVIDASPCTSTAATFAPSPRLPSLDLSGARGRWDDKIFAEDLSPPKEEHKLQSPGTGVSSWVEDDEEDGEVLVIARTPKLT